MRQLTSLDAQFLGVETARTYEELETVICGPSRAKATA
jgi:hypothetical protein